MKKDIKSMEHPLMDIKNNEVMNAVENVSMDEQTMQAIIDDNIEIVPKNQRKKFDALSLEAKIAKLQFYQDIATMRAEAKVKNSIPNKVKELFEKRHANVEDAKQVLKYAQEFIDNYRMMQIAELDKQIAELEAMKEAL